MSAYVDPKQRCGYNRVSFNPKEHTHDPTNEGG